MDLDILNLLAAGGDMATIVLCLVLWRFDRRIFRLETFFERKKYE